MVALSFKTYGECGPIDMAGLNDPVPVIQDMSEQQVRSLYDRQWNAVTPPDVRFNDGAIAVISDALTWVDRLRGDKKRKIPLSEHITSENGRSIFVNLCQYLWHVSKRRRDQGIWEKDNVLREEQRQLAAFKQYYCSLR